MPKIGKVGLSKDLASTPIESGFLFTSDTKQLYVDYNDGAGKKREQLTAEKKNIVKSVTVTDGSLKVETLDGQSNDYEVGTKYNTGDATTAGIVKLYTGTGNNADGSMTQQAITNALNEKANSSHSHAISDISDLQTTLDSKLSATSSSYVKNISIDGTQVTITKGDGSSSKLTTKDTTYSVFSGATSSAAGNSGLVPAPAKGEDGKYLKGNGTWADIPTYSTGNATTAGIVKLYTGTGNNTDGSMTQQAITNALNDKLGKSDAAVSAQKLSTSRSFSISGGATASAVQFDGTDNVNLNVTSIDASKLTGTISIDRLPAGALERLVKVQDQNARFALTTSTVQLGDTVQQLDTKVMYVVVDTDNLDNAAGYVEYTAGTAASVPWSGVQGKPSTFTPSSHTHTKSEITDFPSTLKNPTSIKIQLNGGTSEGTDQYTYDGSAAKNINITASSIGAAASSHSHEISDISDLQTTLDAKLPIESDGYVKSISIEGTQVTITKGDGSSSELNTKDTTYSVFGGATSDAAGNSGLVPAPSAGEESTYLKGNGDWASTSEIISNCVKLDGSSTMQGALNMGANNITGVGSLTFNSSAYTPTNDNDAVNKAYVDDAISGVTVTCDTALNSTSTNPVQNKVLYSKIQELTNSIASVKTTAQTALTNANSAKTVTDKYKTLLNIIGNNQ